MTNQNSSFFEIAIWFVFENRLFFALGCFPKKCLLNSKNFISRIQCFMKRTKNNDEDYFECFRYCDRFMNHALEKFRMLIRLKHKRHSEVYLFPVYKVPKVAENLASPHMFPFVCCNHNKNLTHFFSHQTQTIWKSLDCLFVCWITSNNRIKKQPQIQ